MTKIRDAFKDGKAFIPFLTCGDPDLETTEKLVCAMAEAGADLIELEIPFSDPTAEGPVIQEANVRALSAGTTTDKIFDMVVRIRKTVKISLVFMTYANVVFSYGSERFISKAAEIGINGLILPDVPYEEKEEFEPICKKYGLDLISMIAPTSDHRIAMVAKEATGFIYVVSSLGVTGVRSEIKTDIGALVEQIHAVTDVPVRISEPEQAKKMAGLSDGAIVGSAVVKRIAKYGKDCVPYVAEYVKEMKQAVKGAKERLAEEKSFAAAFFVYRKFRWNSLVLQRLQRCGHRWEILSQATARRECVRILYFRKDRRRRW